VVDRALARVRARYAGLLPSDELRAAGYAAWAEASIRYDARRQVPFGAFAYGRILGAMLDAVRGEWRHERLRSALAREASGGSLCRDARVPAARQASDGGVQDTAAAELVREARQQEQDTSMEARIADGSARGRSLRRLREAAARLPPHDRAILDLHYVEGMELGAIATRTGRGYATVRRRHQRALRWLGHVLRGPEPVVSGGAQGAIG
jgi:RNA polymerase sigma factor for flagellar operon FliA